MLEVTPYVTKDISEVIIKGSILHKYFLKNRVRENKTLLAKQRNYYVLNLKISKKKYFSNVIEKRCA